MTTTEPASPEFASRSLEAYHLECVRASDPAQGHYLTTDRVYCGPQFELAGDHGLVSKIPSTGLPEHEERFSKSASSQQYGTHLGSYGSLKATAGVSRKPEKLPNNFKTTYAETFSELNSAKNADMNGLAPPNHHESVLKLFQNPPNQEGKNPIIKKNDTIQLAASNTFKTVYMEKFSDIASDRKLGSSTELTGRDKRKEIRTETLYGTSAWGVSERPPPYIPGPQWSYSDQDTHPSMAYRSTYETSYQHRTRTRDVVSNDVATNQHFTVLGMGQIATDRRHDSFSRYHLLDKNGQEGAEAVADTSAVNIALTMPPKKQNATDSFVEAVRGSPQDSLVLRENQQARRNAGLDAFQESAYKFEPNKARIDLGVPYCKPWKPLDQLYFTVPSQDFPVSHIKPVAPADRFTPVSPTARFDGRTAGLRLKGQDQ
ncbi:hypothetical protein TGRUB_203590 [Toxoplasma gondii RUB]|uniref:Uncharacterized protein n=10 Tax=Toxoplasma gondii TaxID=5811 RepID=B9PUA3_TOXGV|nr:hypothetical protein TGGT1_203590 [Toxoplasma gondii GT1]ESS33083.1 hypothetical protein TGVEG_203590 [Toxoplasma gondii VEG]KAF4642816.1 hypothetical protein TGRH88_035430 [Toxoplasma gondii]KFG37884.1 hypothetical protein TGDOM2_203590 [Toxoplasma gondii GAB2-2007-GAL-DOM2]KFG39361.1 hypothetical protein TGFOU_203590 [Toxoplasma gondii FOU]KFG46202.1 hypothetical protein TGP89_203590 [Toxoplasma gondii p89]KFG61841.1 hypothetical protein TGRUB_203590 [Toxoplasma gondii RUB]KFH07215.1 hy